MFYSVLFFVIIMVALIIPGFVLRKAKMFSDNALGSVINIMLYACAPMLIFNSLMYDSESGIEPLESGFLLGLVAVFALALVVMLITFFVARVAFIKCDDDKRKSAYTFASVFGNVGFIGIPFLEYVLTGETILPYALVYATLYNVAFHVLTWTLGVYIMTGSASDFNFKKIIQNPVIISTIIALPLFLLKIDLSLYFPPVCDAIYYIATMTTPISLIIVGVRLADAPLVGILKDKFGYISTFLRIVITPLIAVTIMLLIRSTGILGAEGDEFYETIGRAVCMTVVILSGLPTATSTIAFAEKFGGDGEASINSFINSTIFTLIVLPLLIPLLCSFF